MKSNLSLLTVFKLTFTAFLLSCGSSDSPSKVFNASGQHSTASFSQGSILFDKNCKLCHGTDGRLGLNGAKDLSLSLLPISERVYIVTNGKNLMTPFKEILSAAEIDSVAAFTLQFRQSKPE